MPCLHCPRSTAPGFLGDKLLAVPSSERCKLNQRIDHRDLHVLSVVMSSEDRKLGPAHEGRRRTKTEPRVKVKEAVQVSIANRNGTVRINSTGVTFDRLLLCVSSLVAATSTAKKRVSDYSYIDNATLQRLVSQYY